MNRENKFECTSMQAFVTILETRQRRPAVKRGLERRRSLPADSRGAQMLAGLVLQCLEGQLTRLRATYLQLARPSARARIVMSRLIVTY